MGRRHHKKYESSSSESSCTESESEYSCSSSGSSVSEHELREVEHKLTKKMERLYCKFLWKLRREPCLLVNGSDAHASVYSYTVHSTTPGGNIVFDKSQYAVNVDYTDGDDFITVRRTGLYFFSWNAQFNEPCQLGLFVNGVLDATTVMSNNSGATVTAASQMLRLTTGDVIQIRNLGNNIITSTLAATGNPLLQSQNFDFTLFKIAPLIDICGAFPEPYPAPTCPDCPQEPHTPPPHHPPCPPPHPHSPKCNKDKKCEKKFNKLDKNDDGMLSYDEYKKYCEKRRKHNHH
jgi:hypothetical protein